VRYAILARLFSHCMTRMELTNTLSRSERDCEIMFSICGLHRYTSRFLRIVVPLCTNAFLIVGFLSPVWYPQYYPTQTPIWTSHIALIFPCYNYLLYLRRNWDTCGFYEHGTISKQSRWISLAFYGLFMFYWAYFAVIQFTQHQEEPWFYQVGNAVMSTAWYFFFSVSSAVYYYCCILLLQRATIVKSCIKEMCNTMISKHTSVRFLTDDEQTKLRKVFYGTYNREYKKIRQFSKRWNIILILIILVLLSNIPIDLISILYNKMYYEIVGVIIKFSGFVWFILTVCKLNSMNEYILTYFCKHHLLQDTTEELREYTVARPLALNFYGLQLTYRMVTTFLLFVFNLIIPTLYGLITNNIV
jgi:hypothetical protein